MSDLSGIMEAALEISERRRNTRAQMREAMERGDLDTLLRLLRDYLGMEPSDEEKSYRIDKSEHRLAG